MIPQMLEHQDQPLLQLKGLTPPESQNHQTLIEAGSGNTSCSYMTLQGLAVL